MSEDERAALDAADLSGAPVWVRGDFPEWLAPHFARAFGDRAADEGVALSARAPLDLRVNALKATREKALAELAHLGPQPCRFAPLGLRIEQGQDGRAPALAAEPAYVRGLVEIQDEGSQIAARLARATPGEQVLDLCAGGGGKSLALAGDMDNSGQIYATDSDGRRLTPIFARLDRAGVRNVQVRAPRGPAHDPVADLAGACDLVLVDAPCTGTGTWRRNPDAKWRMRPGALEQRIKAQDEVLARAAHYVKPGGRLVYVTCSLLARKTRTASPTFSPRIRILRPNRLPKALSTRRSLRSTDAASPHGPGLRLSPSRHGTDGFYAVVLRRAG